MAITIPLSDADTRKVSDGYHTFEELYDHRVLLFIALARNTHFNVGWRPHYPGWPILFIWGEFIPQISYHFPEKYLPLVEKHFERNDTWEWDGHTSADVLKRLEKLCE